MHKINTFVRRKQNRMTPSQKRALHDDKLNYLRASPEDILQSSMPIILDVGFGMGDSLISLANRYSDHSIMGIDIFQPGIARVMALANENNLTNLKVIDGDAVDIIAGLPDSCLSGVQLLFPDPWPKKRHIKRRFIQIERLNILYSKLALGGWFRLITDSLDYYSHAQECLVHTKFKLSKESFGSDIKTKYWLRALSLGNEINELLCIK